MMSNDGTVRGIYCHFDGYPEGVGATLLESYGDTDKVEALLALGSLSILGPEIDEPHGFDEYKTADGTLRTTAYHRDRGEEYSRPWKWPSVAAKLEDGGWSGTEYTYLWTGREWWYAPRGAIEVKPLASRLPEIVPATVRHTGPAPIIVPVK